MRKSSLREKVWERENRLPKDNADFRRLTEIYQISEEWLLTGEGAPPQATYERRAQARLALLSIQQGGASWLEALPQHKAHALVGHGVMDLRMRDRALNVDPVLLKGAVGERRIALR